MFQRVLWTSLTQALRSVALLLLPLSFITLIAWATAGSVNGNTSDPIRAASWIWLGAHNIPFSLQLPPSGAAGYLSYLPLGGLVLPFISIRNGLSRTLEKLTGDYASVASVRLIFSATYTLIAVVLALVSGTSEVRPSLLFTFLYVFLLAGVSSLSVGGRNPMTAPVIFASRALAALLALSFIVLAIAIFTHLDMMKNLTIVLGPGIIGGVLLLFLGILYLPNFAVAVLSYFSGAGFAVGDGTLVTPYLHRLGEIPAFPLFGAIPTGAHPLALLGVIPIIAAGVFLVIWTVEINVRVLWQSLFIVFIGLVAIAYAGSGALLTDVMGSVGVSPWKMPLLISAEIGVGVVGALFIPQLIERFTGRKQP